MNETIKVSEQSNKIPRPPNAFILYRRRKQIGIKAQNKNLTNAQISKVISKMWKDENHETILYYEKLADTISKNSLKINAKTLSTLSFTHPKESPDISIINENNTIPFDQLYFDTSKYFDENNKLNFDTSTNFNENNINYPIYELNFGTSNINRLISFNELYFNDASLNFNNPFTNFYSM
ncbi:1344_t:CDS:2 [Dentiscutata erythropus]|uniref:1344_t:CDS:1 n=1 Tax=Dentiscutata erythropus TaxID=1348616 RepID=A0A9N8YZQ4_9GLOM|nr:1344_t:CDS:2 [Dentiscutata erythropus]